MADETAPAGTYTSTATLGETSKPIWRSKTAIVNLLMMMAPLVPAVASWLRENPIAIPVVLSAVNLVLRFVTKDKVHWLTDDSGDVSGGSGGSDGSSFKSLGGGGRDPGALQFSGFGFSRRVLAGSWLAALALVAMLLLLPSCSPTSVAAWGSAFDAKAVLTHIDGNGNSASIVIRPKVKELKSLKAAPLRPVPSGNWRELTAFEWCDPQWQLKQRRLCLARIHGGEEADAATGNPLKGNPLPRPF